MELPSISINVLDQKTLNPIIKTINVGSIEIIGYKQAKIYNFELFIKKLFLDRVIKPFNSYFYQYGFKLIDDTFDLKDHNILQVNINRYNYADKIEIIFNPENILHIPLYKSMYELLTLDGDIELEEVCEEFNKNIDDFEKLIYKMFIPEYIAQKPLEEQNQIFKNCPTLLYDEEGQEKNKDSDNYFRLDRLHSDSTTILLIWLAEK